MQRTIGSVFFSHGDCLVVTLDQMLGMILLNNNYFGRAIVEAALIEKEGLVERSVS